MDIHASLNNQPTALFWMDSNCIFFCDILPPSGYQQLIMSSKQKLINLTTILLAISALYYLTTSFQQKQQVQQKSLRLLEIIANGQPLDEQMLKSVAQIGTGLTTAQSEVSPSCFIKAYYQLVVNKQVNPETLFALFQQSAYEYDHVTNCSHYLALLLHRAQQLTEANRPKVMTHLLAEQKAWLQQKYPKEGKQTQICAYFSSYNNEQTVKSQVKAIATQAYENFLVVVEDDGSSDNTHIFAKYTLDEAKNDRITLVLQKQRKGLLNRFQEFLGKCRDDSVVVVLSGNDTLLGDNVFWTLDRVFTNSQVDLAFFSSLTTPHANIQSLNKQQDPNSIYNPVIAFRKQLTKDMKIPSSTDLSFDRNVLAYHLKKAASSSEVISEVIVSRPSNKYGEHTEQLQKLSEQLKGV